MANPINEFIGIIREEGKYYNEPSFFIGEIKSKLPDLKIEINNIILEKEDILIDSWMLDRQIESFDTETNQEHQHEVKNPFIDKFESGDTVIMFKIGDKFAVVSKLVSL
ncbi:DUF2577 domain-containing protein [Clostridioides difficile]|uniref:DUF2577 family protein n=1 Tax=Clostridioides difficile TaxID=1496 RepID=UPI00093D2952|nr:DUF2577 family protein [Clostridioides difficile]EGT3801914.1 DUF2577 domain-containing protein [Clostridioides difficile]EGT4004172.1 DUF2577 domain-containing protein [Clostridioides difficile]EGT5271481.1 DUF2577 domain-containing protein [Clostridioides difficile]EGT5470896.1 DUF2577 domain-containing protein [Clostridioides difficile]MBH6911122.1 DUF2577 family protein [Clostridioides difficile]